MVSSTDIFKSFWGSLNQRQQEVLTGRFGLEKNKSPQTLAAIGERYGITRERVRQIENAALKIVREKISGNPHVKELFEKSRKFLAKSGGVAPQDNLLSHVNTQVSNLSQNHLALLLAASGAFYHYQEDDAFWPFYYVDQASVKNVSAFIARFADTLEDGKEKVLSGGYDDIYKKFVKVKTVQKDVADNYVTVSKKIGTNPYGDVGLTDWPEINPSTIRDRIYLVLKKKGQPLHFQSIAEMINTAGFHDRPALTPTVHNELIKDNRFILVGRGIYGLAEHGFAPGTAREVIHRILKNHGPLRPKDVITKVQEERFLKANTVLVNLQNKEHFERLHDGTYRVRES